ncbi:MAG: pyridoxamine 5'-phosphate oxidase [Planctomycetaceae bacterium]|nr:pyridoxamine 5'-phosphate oxidase [Planctomycetaceae bacterium]HCA38848.1 pyridoxamine 5'-phosphate oxidase [Phycisphaerales bacterium]
MDALSNDPVEAMQRWLDDATEFAGRPNPNAVALATVDGEGRPTLRMMLLKGLDERGAVIYTNLHSRKATQIAANPKVALLMHWDVLGRQIRIEGSVTPVSDEEADTYFASRPWASKIGAVASDQSSPLESREQLAERVIETAMQYPLGSDVPRPPHWSGLRVSLDRVELWQEGDDRLHDRIVFTPTADGTTWTKHRLWP